MNDIDSLVTTNVAIGIATFMRPEGLARLLSSLQELKMPDLTYFTLQVIVVDNDPHCSAQEVVQHARRELPWPILYAAEPKRGIPSVRNRVVSLCSNCDFLAFIDDDEYADPDWLVELLTTQQRHDAAAVLGPVIPVFPSGTSRWIVQGQFFCRQRHATGTSLSYGSTANVLINLSVLGGDQKPFDERLALTGAEDTLFFMQLLQRDASVVWCDEAVVFETIPESRATLRWLLKRAYRTGNSYTRCERLMDSGAKIIALRIVKGAGRVIIGLTGLLLSPARDRAFAGRMCVNTSKGVGMLAGLIGHRYEEYRNVHGT